MNADQHNSFIMPLYEKHGSSILKSVQNADPSSQKQSS